MDTQHHVYHPWQIASIDNFSLYFFPCFLKENLIAYFISNFCTDIILFTAYYQVYELVINLIRKYPGAIYHLHFNFRFDEIVFWIVSTDFIYSWLAICFIEQFLQPICVKVPLVWRNSCHLKILWACQKLYRFTRFSHLGNIFEGQNDLFTVNL